MSARAKPSPEMLAFLARKVLDETPRLPDGTLVRGVTNPAVYEAIIHVCEKLTVKAHMRNICASGGKATRDNHSAEWRSASARHAAMGRWRKVRERNEREKRD